MILWNIMIIYKQTGRNHLYTIMTHFRLIYARILSKIISLWDKERSIEDSEHQ